MNREDLLHQNLNRLAAFASRSTTAQENIEINLTKIERSLTKIAGEMQSARQDYVQWQKLAENTNKWNMSEIAGLVTAVSDRIARLRD